MPFDLLNVGSLLYQTSIKPASLNKGEKTALPKLRIDTKQAYLPTEISFLKHTSGSQQAHLTSHVS